MASGMTAQLRVSTEEELRAKLAEAKEELFNLRFQGATGQLESHGRLRAVRKEIARSLPWLYSCPVAPWKRRLNSSSLASASLARSSSSVETRSCAVMPLAIRPHRPLA